MSDRQIIGLVLGIGAVAVGVALLALWTVLAIRRDYEARMRELYGEVAALAYRIGREREGR